MNFSGRPRNAEEKHAWMQAREREAWEALGWLARNGDRLVEQGKQAASRGLARGEATLRQVADLEAQQTQRNVENAARTSRRVVNVVGNAIDAGKKAVGRVGDLEVENARRQASQGAGLVKTAGVHGRQAVARGDEVLTGLGRQQVAQAERAVATDAAAAKYVGSIASAAFLDHPPTEARPKQAPMDHGQVRERMRETEDDIRRNLEAAARSGDPDAMGGAWPAAFGQWVGKVRPGGVWDDKAHPVRSAGSLEARGNYNYGATARALGVPEPVALWGAGLAQRASNVWGALGGRPPSPSVGSPILMTKSFGDDPRDQADIRRGYRAGQ